MRTIIAALIGVAALTPATVAGAEAPDCRTPVTVTAAAEAKVGGADYAGPNPADHAGHLHMMPQMQGAHSSHEPQRGGSFFMAPNKMHHLEGVYSEACGFQLFLNNAFTEPIRADRFRAFLRAIPSAEDEPDAMRFLVPAADNTMLAAPLGDEVRRPFEIELFVKFPESDAPERFDILVPAKNGTAEAADAKVVNLDIIGRKIPGDTDVIRVTQDDTVKLRWTSDEPLSVHVHGYDVQQAVAPGAVAEMTLHCFAAGRFPVTIHLEGEHASHAGGHGGADGETVLLYLEVYPN